MDIVEISPYVHVFYSPRMKSNVTVVYRTREVSSHLANYIILSNYQGVIKHGWGQLPECVLFEPTAFNQPRITKFVALIMADNSYCLPRSSPLNLINGMPSLTEEPSSEEPS
jgi:hypothetical protein